MSAAPNTPPGFDLAKAQDQSAKILALLIQFLDEVERPQAAIVAATVIANALGLMLTGYPDPAERQRVVAAILQTAKQRLHHEQRLARAAAAADRATAADRAAAADPATHPLH